MQACCGQRRAKAGTGSLRRRYGQTTGE
jgi:hypothetical protein